MATYPSVLQTVLDTTDARAAAEFYRQLLGYVYRPGHETTDPAGDDWLVLLDEPGGERRLAFQQVDQLTPSTWPDAAVPQQLHLDMTVPSLEELLAQHDRVLALGGRMIFDRLDDPDEPLRVYADLDGHPFCIFVG
ncbi:VOC family protein [Jiangella mangrovi]|uniref:Catechol 2,3-dioxygenase-like lactoylglutathione lyase family enzyme n=1 Tax=Jiangella mangrovi TaxID=1524084 RepID=A0A7W9GM17_9ACTN|nr:VOC family protein [Jiangella mangrovi]MBB5786362.1 catechol 2,3-dioxygenase-like lactoylglutathione lyase family enzyme [Jiangella mangrovi]